MTTAVVLTPEYLSTQETCARLHLSPRTLEAWVKDQRIQSTLEPRPGRKPERVYLRSDVERIERENAARAERQPERAAVTPKPTPLLLAPEVADTARTIAAEFREQVPVDKKLTLSYAEAAALSGIPRAYVKRLAEAGELEVLRFGRRIRVKRTSLEAYCR